MALTYTLNSQSYNGRYMYLSLTQIKDIASNTSKVNWTLTVTGGSSNYYSTGATTVKINNVTVYEKARVEYSQKEFPAAKGSISGSLTVTHDSEGKLTIPVSITTAIYYGALETKSGSWALDSNPRQAKLVTAPNFTDEQNPTITYTNPAGNSVDKLQICITLEGNKDDISYRDISKTSTSYTFNLTDAERTILRKATTGSNSRTVKFYLKTVIGGITFYSKSGAKTFTVVNGAPTLNPTISDTDSNMLALTGDSNRIVKYYSDAKYTIGASAKKDATIVSQKVTCGAKSASAASGTLSNVEAATFTFTATDSRGNTVTKKLDKTLINYVKLSCNLKVSQPTTDGIATISISGNYFNGSFGAVSNSLKIWYRIKEGNGDYSEWYGITATLKDNTYTATKEFTGLDYQKYYTIQAAAQDAIIEQSSAKYIYSAAVKVKAKPVFDWGEEDFNFNVPVSINGVVLDYIIEQGTKDGWSYRKWNSGKAECWKTVTLNTTINNNWGSMYMGTATQRQSYPFTFKVKPTENATLQCKSIAALLMTMHGGNGVNDTQTTASYNVFSPSNTDTSAEFYISFYVSGNWK